MSDLARRILAVVRREWWVVALTMAVAASIPLLVSRDTYTPEPLFEGRSKIVVEIKTLNDYSRLPTVDELLADVASPVFRNAVAEELQLPVESLSRLRVYSVKSPQSAVMVAYRSADATEALTIAGAIAKQVAHRAQVLGKDEGTQLRRRIDILDDGIAELGGLVAADDMTVERYKRAYISGTVWEMKLEREELNDELRKVRQAYSVRGESTLQELPAIQRSATGLAGALLGGLAAGVAIAAVREALLRRKSHDAASA